MYSILRMNYLVNYKNSLVFLFDFVLYKNASLFI